MGDFKWYADDSICHNCHNHCSLADPGCDVGKRTAERKRNKKAEVQEEQPLGKAQTCG